MTSEIDKSKTYKNRGHRLFVRVSNAERAIAYFSAASKQLTVSDYLRELIINDFLNER